MAILYIRDELNEYWLPCVEDLGSLPDVQLSSNIQTGDILIYDYNSGSPRWSSGSFSAGSGGGGASYLYALLDTDISSPQEGHILVYTSGAWTNTPQSGSSGDMYKSVYDTNDDGTVDSADTSGSAGIAGSTQKIRGRTVSSGAPSPGQVLGWNAGNYWEPQTVSSGSAGVVPWDGVQDKPSTYPPSTHASSHQNGGGDEISVAGLSGTLADAQNAGQIRSRNIETGVPADGQVMVWRSSPNEWQYEDQTGGSSPGGEGAGGAYTQRVEDLSAQIPGTHFDTSYEFDPNTLMVFYNGVHQQPSKYTEDEDYTGFTTNFQTYNGDAIAVMYFQGVSSGSGATTISIAEQDGSPYLSGIHTIQVGNGDLINVGEGIVRIKTAANVTVAVSDQDVLKMQIFS